MRQISSKLRAEILMDPFYEECCLAGMHNHICGGRITWEHALIYAHRQINEKWAIIPVCAAGQDVDEYQDAGTMRKELNVWVALNRASNEQLEAISKVIDYKRERDRLNKIYGVYVSPEPQYHTVGSGIKY